jgi:hypothetical protein
VGDGRFLEKVESMEEKRYPKMGEEDSFGCMHAEEPTGIASYTEMPIVDTVAFSSDIEELSDTFKEPLAGPSTYEEAIHRIEEAEQEIERAETYDWKDVLREARQRVKTVCN